MGVYVKSIDFNNKKELKVAIDIASSLNRKKVKEASLEFHLPDRLRQMWYKAFYG